MQLCPAPRGAVLQLSISSTLSLFEITATLTDSALVPVLKTRHVPRVVTLVSRVRVGRGGLRSCPACARLENPRRTASTAPAVYVFMLISFTMMSGTMFLRNRPATHARSSVSAARSLIERRLWPHRVADDV